VTSRAHGLQREPTSMSHQTLFSAQQKPVKVQQIGKGTSLSQAPQPRRPLLTATTPPVHPDRRGEQDAGDADDYRRPAGAGNPDVLQRPPQAPLHAPYSPPPPSFPISCSFLRFLICLCGASHTPYVVLALDSI
jgi:hypothetical protein